jgi:hypothetical protein
MIYVNTQEALNEHEHGTKVFVYPSKNDSQNLYKFVTEVLRVKAEKVMKPDQYHCTVIYSDHPCPDVEKMHFPMPLVGSIKHWTIFEGALGKCLVAELYSPGIVRLNKKIVDEFGATSNFPSFKAHITIAWGYEGDLPTQLPDFAILFDAYKVSGIDPNWSPSKL